MRERLDATFVVECSLSNFSGVEQKVSLDVIGGDRARSEENGVFRKQMYLTKRIVDVAESESTGADQSAVDRDHRVIREYVSNEIGTVSDGLTVGNGVRCYDKDDFYQMLENQLYETDVDISYVIWKGDIFRREGPRWCGTPMPPEH